eukprot:TRINITY_DN7868_c0_g2_i3.p1 TRINITY_DN7868_c0_g2~~TRINITY_DN7868_c0_g2_i3.p1  ORF type:complete len:115 (-),score=21.07 TRINITY_DN7868_c0_g2_i3:106-450(-)
MCPPGNLSILTAPTATSTSAFPSTLTSTTTSASSSTSTHYHRHPHPLRHPHCHHHPPPHTLPLDHHHTASLSSTPATCIAMGNTVCKQNMLFKKEQEEHYTDDALDGTSTCENK